MLPLRETAVDWRFGRENRLGGGGGGKESFGGAERPVDCAGGGERARAKKLLVCMEVPAHNEMGTALRTIIFSSVFPIRDCFPPYYYSIKCASIAKPDLGACSGWHRLVAFPCTVEGRMYVGTSECKQLEFRQESNSILSSSHRIFSSHSLFSLCGGEHPA